MSAMILITTQSTAQNNPVLSNPAKTKSTNNAQTSSEKINNSSSNTITNPATTNVNNKNNSTTSSASVYGTTSTSVQANVPYDTVINGVKYRKKYYKQSFPAQYRYDYVDQYYYTNYALGLDYTNESYLNKDWYNQEINDLSWDTLGQLKNSSGFNIYFIGKLPLQQFMPIGRLTWGIDMGMNHFRRGTKNNVELSTINKDSGFTRLETMAFNMSAMLRQEYALGRFYPFIGLHGGFALYSTDQYTQSYIQLVDYETSGTVEVRTSATLYWSPEIGFRVRLAPAVSFTASYERRYGNSINITDIHRTTFNGLSYNEKSNSLNYATETFKFGLLFDLGGRERERKEVVPARDTTISYLEAINESNYSNNTQQNNSQQSSVQNPCPCPCPPSVITPNTPTGNNSNIHLQGGTGTLNNGTGTINGGAGSINNGTGSINSGAGSINNGTGSINSGTTNSGLGSSKSKVDGPTTSGEISNSSQSTNTTNKSSSGANILIYGGGSTVNGGTPRSSSTGTGVITPGGSIGTGSGANGGIKLPKGSGTSAKPPVKAFPGISTPPVTIKKPKS